VKVLSTSGGSAIPWSQDAATLACCGEFAVVWSMSLRGLTGSPWVVRRWQGQSAGVATAR
jgi:hypothetical protein